MEKVIQFLVSSQEEAYQVVKTLKDLHKQEAISLAETFVLEKDQQGNVKLKDSSGAIADNTLFGVFAGGLLGLLGGPVGFLVGSSTGALFGSLLDLSDTEAKQQYIQKVAAKIPNGKLLVVSHMYENWTMPIDSSLKGIAEEITRFDVDEEVERAIKTDIDVFNNVIDDTKFQLQSAIEDQKQRLRQRLEELSVKRTAKEEQLKARWKMQKDAYIRWFTRTQNENKS
ncbi:MAG: DUF1269 domain-containing protein [Cyclobacteriaceae bacterium]